MKSNHQNAFSVPSNFNCLRSKSLDIFLNESRKGLTYKTFLGPHFCPFFKIHDFLKLHYVPQFLASQTIQTISWLRISSLPTSLTILNLSQYKISLLNIYNIFSLQIAFTANINALVLLNLMRKINISDSKLLLIYFDLIKITEQK